MGTAASFARIKESFSEAREGHLTRRAFLSLVLFSVIALFFLLRLLYVQIIMAGTYRSQAERARSVSFSIAPRRGTVYDRNGVVIATSVDAMTIYANPVEVRDPNDEAAKLVSVLGGVAGDYLPALTADKTNYSIIKRQADIAVADKVKALSLAGIYFVPESRREYPNGQVGGQIIGACSLEVDTENNLEYYQGISGLEQYYDDILSGKPGYYSAERGRDGTPIPGGVHESKPAVDGQDIIISIDIELQQYVEDRLSADKANLTSHGANSVVMDASTGEIFAAASLPFFNPADRSKVEPGATKLKSVTDLFEPGSIFKTVSMAAILEDGQMNPDTQIFCPSSITADGYTISDAESRGDETLSLRQILDQSSNVGISLTTEKMGFDKLYDKINKYNLHTKTGVDYPGEGEAGTNYLGSLLPFSKWSRVAGYNAAFGQGLSLTSLQIIRFYGSIVNGGVEVTPHFLVSKPQQGETPAYPTADVIDHKSILPTLTDMLRTVVTDGTGKKAAIEGYQVAGKTSTAEIYDEKNGGYRKGVYNLAFLGFLAHSSSHLVCFVGANEVPYDGVVTPLFKDIMSSAIDRFNIYPE